MATNHKVEFEYIETEGEIRKEPQTIPIGEGARHLQEKTESADGVRLKDRLEGPWVINGEPYVGPLTDAELKWLHMLPGKSFNAHWRFVVSEVN